MNISYYNSTNTASPPDIGTCVNIVSVNGIWLRQKTQTSIKNSRAAHQMCSKKNLQENTHAEV